MQTDLVQLLLRFHVQFGYDKLLPYTRLMVVDDEEKMQTSQWYLVYYIKYCTASGLE